MISWVTPPWRHQAQAVEKALAARDFALLLDVGTGKSKTLIDILRNRYAENKRILRTLILCPVIVCENWRREWQKNSKIGHSVTVLEGTGKKRLEIFCEKIAKNPAHVFVTNYESLQMKELFKALKTWQPEVLVADESQRLKGYDSVRSKATAELAMSTVHNYILSGSPVLNSPFDLFGQWRTLDRGATFGHNFFQFRARYFVDKNASMPKHNYFPKWELRPEMWQVFQDIVARSSMRVLKSECLDLPDLTRVEIPVVMSPEQRRLYNSMRDHFVAYLQSGEAVTAQVAIVKALRLQQLATGFATTEDGAIVPLKENTRIKALADLLEDIPESEKFIIWCSFRENYRQVRELLEKLQIKFVELHGEVKASDRQKNIDLFQGENDTRGLIANQGSAGEGVTLTRASISIFYSRTFNFGHDLQAEARNHRGGSEIHKKITRYDLVARDSIDKIIAESLQNKQDMSEKILELRNKL